MRFVHVRALVALGSLAAAAGCGPFHRGAAERAAIVFTNESLDQADVYVTIADAQAVRLGTVLATHTDTLYVPSSVTARGAQVNIVARVFARSAQPSSGPVTLLAGDVIRVRMPSDERVLIVTPGG
jgi:hypothetical protein